MLQGNSLVEKARGGHFIQIPASVGNDLRAVWPLLCPFIPLLPLSSAFAVSYETVLRWFFPNLTWSSFPYHPSSVMLDAVVSLEHLNMLWG